jgi:hypothetical protein
LIDHCRKPHNTLVSFANEIGVSLQTLANWADKYKDFKRARELARQIQLGFHDREGSVATYGGKIAFHQNAWQFRMKSQFGWRDDGPPDLDPDELEWDYGDDPKTKEGDDDDGDD